MREFLREGPRRGQLTPLVSFNPTTIHLGREALGTIDNRGLSFYPISCTWPQAISCAAKEEIVALLHFTNLGDSRIQPLMLNPSVAATVY